MRMPMQGGGAAAGSPTRKPGAEARSEPNGIPEGCDHHGMRVSGIGAVQAAGAKLSLQDYLRNSPANMNEETAAEDTAAFAAAAATEKSQQNTANLGGRFAIGPYEAEWLRRLRNDPGYQILLKVLDNIVAGYEAGATQASQADPLGNREAVANAWAYVTMGRRIQQRLISDVEEAAAGAKAGE